MTQLFTQYLLISATLGVISALFLLALPRLSRRASARSLHAVLVLLLVAFLVPWRPALPGIPQRIASPRVQASSSAAYSTQASAPILQNATPPQAQPNNAGTTAPSVDPLRILAILWLFGACITLAFHLWRHFRFLRAIGRWREPIRDAQTLAAFDAARQAMGVKGKVALQACPAISTPMLTGFLRPCILLPDVPLPEADIRLILAHELAHFRRGDLYTKAITLLATACHWFNPVVHLIAGATSLQCELACDAVVMRGADLTIRRRYGAAIISIVRGQRSHHSSLTTTFNGGKNDMKRRIHALIDIRSKRLGILVLCAALALILLTGAAFATSTSIPSEKPAEDALSAYVTHGLVIDPDTGVLSLHGKTIRTFEDIDATYTNVDGGDIDAYAVTVIRPGSEDEVIGIGTYSDADFAMRTPGWEAAAAKASGKDAVAYDSDAAIDGALAALEGYMRAWQEIDYEAMVRYASPAWCAEQDNAAQQLYWNHNWWKLESWEIASIETWGNPTSITIEAMLRKANYAGDLSRMEYTVYLAQEDGAWYVAPDTMQTGIVLPLDSDESVHYEDAAAMQAARNQETATHYEEYAPLGLTYDAQTDSLTYQDTRVRYFEDILSSNGESLKGGNFIGTLRTHLDAEGTIDLYTVRDEAGQLVSLETYTQEDFDARTETWEMDSAKP